MSDNPKKLLLTRPLAQSEVYAKDLKDIGVEALIASMLEIEPRAFTMPDISAFQAILFTSMNGIEQFCAQHGAVDLPVYVVGDASADCARQYGFVDVQVADGDAQSLATLLKTTLKPEDGGLLYVRGEDISYSLTPSLDAHGFSVCECAAYKARQIEHLSDDVVAALCGGEIGAVTFFSKRTAENFVKLILHEKLEQALSNTKALCIRDSVVGCVQSLPWEGIYVAKTPDKEAVTALVQEHF